LLAVKIEAGKYQLSREPRYNTIGVLGARQCLNQREAASDILKAPCIRRGEPA
jgi:hypothetical protein